MPDELLIAALFFCCVIEGGEKVPKAHYRLANGLFSNYNATFRLKAITVVLFPNRHHLSLLGHQLKHSTAKLPYTRQFDQFPSLHWFQKEPQQVCYRLSP